MLISEIRDELIVETGGDTSDTGLQSKMLTIMKGALRMLPAKARTRTLVRIDTATLAAQAQTVSLPSGFIHEVSKQSVWYIDGNRRQAIYRAERDAFNDLWTSDSSGKPQYFRVYNKTMEFNRKADTAMTIYFEFFIEVADIAADDTFFGDDTVIATFKELAKFVFYHDYEEDESKGKTHLQIAQDLMGEMDGQYMADDLGTHVEES